MLVPNLALRGAIEEWQQQQQQQQQQRQWQAASSVAAVSQPASAQPQPQQQQQQPQQQQQQTQQQRSKPRGIRTLCDLKRVLASPTCPQVIDLGGCTIAEPPGSYLDNIQLKKEGTVLRNGTLVLPWRTWLEVSGTRDVVLERLTIKGPDLPGKLEAWWV